MRPSHRLILASAAALLSARLAAVGLAQEDSYPGLRAIQAPLRITWNLDAVTARQLGGGPAFADDVGAVVFKRLKEHGVPMRDGSFDPLAEAFVNVDAWARGTTSAEDPKDPQRAFHFELQVFAPTAAILDESQNSGRILVWERSAYGVVPKQQIQPAFRTFLNVCDDFAVDWRSAHAENGSAEGASAEPTATPTPTPEPELTPTRVPSIRFGNQ
jgi:hypothetical protein